MCLFFLSFYKNISYLLFSTLFYSKKEKRAFIFFHISSGNTANNSIKSLACVACSACYCYFVIYSYSSSEYGFISILVMKNYSQVKQGTILWPLKVKIIFWLTEAIIAASRRGHFIKLSVSSPGSYRRMPFKLLMPGDT